MIKLIGPMHRLDGMSREDFAKYYVEEHTKVGGGFPGHVKYVGSPAICSANGDDPPFDAVAELWWESMDALRAAYPSEMWNRARADHPSVVSGRLMFVVDEHEFMAPPAPGEAVKYYAFLSRKDLMSREEFRRYLLEDHVPLALKTPGLIGYRACPAISTANGDGVLLDPQEAPQFDASIEMWFEDVDAFKKSFADKFWDELREDYYQRLAMGRIQLLVKEHLVFDHTT